MRRIERFLSKKEQDISSWEFETLGLCVETFLDTYTIIFDENGRPRFTPSTWYSAYLHFNPLDEDVPTWHPEQSFAILRQGYTALRQYVIQVEQGKQPKPHVFLANTSPEMANVAQHLGLQDVTSQYLRYGSEHDLDRLSKRELYARANEVIAQGWLQLLLPFVPPFTQVPNSETDLILNAIIDPSVDQVNDTYEAYQIIERLGHGEINRFLNLKLTQKEFEDGLDDCAHCFDIDLLRTDGVVLQGSYATLKTRLDQISTSPLGRRYSRSHR